jgi:hypothetical protein
MDVSKIQLFLDKCLSVNKKWIPYLIIVVLGITLFVVKRFTAVNRDHGFDRRVSYIEYTQHAKCRMQCRQITQAEVEEIMKDGEINYKKTDVNARPCPAYALEGVTADNQRVRIVFGQCDLKTKVITCIDLNTDWECHCPGDDNKYKNKN